MNVRHMYADATTPEERHAQGVVRPTAPARVRVHLSAGKARALLARLATWNEHHDCGIFSFDADGDLEEPAPGKGE